MTAPDLIVLNDADNVATALRDLPTGQPAKVAGTHGALADLTPRSEIRLGHKAAIRAIRSGELVVKHGYPIGRATADIAAGEHVHVHNVLSLSRETDIAVDTSDEGV
jgi:altronate hydrolase